MAWSGDCKVTREVKAGHASQKYAAEDQAVSLGASGVTVGAQCYSWIDLERIDVPKARKGKPPPKRCRLTFIAPEVDAAALLGSSKPGAGAGAVAEGGNGVSSSAAGGTPATVSLTIAFPSPEACHSVTELAKGRRKRLRGAIKPSELCGAKRPRTVPHPGEQGGELEAMVAQRGRALSSSMVTNRQYSASVGALQDADRLRQDEQFWRGREREVEESQWQEEEQQTGGTTAFLADGASQNFAIGRVITETLTKERIAAIFVQYPAIHAAYVELVMSPTPQLTAQDFWKKYFVSAHYYSDRESSSNGGAGLGGAAEGDSGGASVSDIFAPYERNRLARGAVRLPGHDGGEQHLAGRVDPLVDLTAVAADRDETRPRGTDEVAHHLKRRQAREARELDATARGASGKRDAGRSRSSRPLNLSSLTTKKTERIIAKYNRHAFLQVEGGGGGDADEDVGGANAAAGAASGSSVLAQSRQPLRKRDWSRASVARSDTDLVLAGAIALPELAPSATLEQSSIELKLKCRPMIGGGSSAAGHTRAQSPATAAPASSQGASSTGGVGESTSTGTGTGTGTSTGGGWTTVSSSSSSASGTGGAGATGGWTTVSTGPCAGSAKPPAPAPASAPAPGPAASPRQGSGSTDAEVEEWIEVSLVPGAAQGDAPSSCSPFAEPCSAAAVLQDVVRRSQDCAVSGAAARRGSAATAHTQKQIENVFYAVHELLRRHWLAHKDRAGANGLGAQSAAVDATVKDLQGQFKAVQDLRRKLLKEQCLEQADMLQPLLNQIGRATG